MGLGSLAGRNGTKVDETEMGGPSKSQSSGCACTTLRGRDGDGQAFKARPAETLLVLALRWAVPADGSSESSSSSA